MEIAWNIEGLLKTDLQISKELLKILWKCWKDFKEKPLKIALKYQKILKCPEI